jgi:hypothetical protein
VQNGDYERYRATCHPSGVIVLGTEKASHPLSKALDRWKQGFLDTKAGKMKAGVEFKFSQRLRDETTAHETGIFHYWTVEANGKRTDAYVAFESLLVKKNGWQTLMEYQKSAATQMEWESLKRQIPRSAPARNFQPEHDRSCGNLSIVSRLVGEFQPTLENRGHFFSAPAQARKGDRYRSH